MRRYLPNSVMQSLASIVLVPALLVANICAQTSGVQTASEQTAAPVSPQSPTAPSSASSVKQPPPRGSQDLYRFRVESELVLVNVVVRDKQGKPVTGLKAEDFTLLEEGKAQKISSFDI